MLAMLIVPDTKCFSSKAKVLTTFHQHKTPWSFIFNVPLSQLDIFCDRLYRSVQFYLHQSTGATRWRGSNVSSVVNTSNPVQGSSGYLLLQNKSKAPNKERLLYFIMCFLEVHGMDSPSINIKKVNSKKMSFETRKSPKVFNFLTRNTDFFVNNAPVSLFKWSCIKYHNSFLLCFWWGFLYNKNTEHSSEITSFCRN